MKSYTLNAMRFIVGFLFLVGTATAAFAQTGAVHVPHDTVSAALAKGGMLAAGAGGGRPSCEAWRA
jgi:hypothetical protein